MKHAKIIKNQAGQALFEYIFIIAFMATFGVGLAKALSTALDGTTKELAWVLSQELAVGVCNTRCHIKKYQNK